VKTVVGWTGLNLREVLLAKGILEDSKLVKIRIK